MVQKILNVDREEFVAWLRRTPKKVAAPPPAPARPKMLSITVPSRDVIVLPAAIFSKREEP